MNQVIIEMTPANLTPIVCKRCKRVLAFGTIKNGSIAIKCRGQGCKKINYLTGDMPLVVPPGSLLEDILADQ